MPVPQENQPYSQELIQQDLMLELQGYDDADLVAVIEALSASVEKRRALGHKRYGVYGLQPFNGRDILRDAFEEVLDAAVYLKALACETEGDFDDSYAAMMTEAMYLQAAIIDREATQDATAPAQTEPEAAAIDEH